MQPPPGVSPEELLQEGPEGSLGRSLEREIGWRALLAGGSTTGAWATARLMGDGAGANTVALLTLVGSQLGQTLVVGRRSPVVYGSSLASLALLGAAVQTPGLSQFFGCRPLGPLGLAQASGWSLAAAALGILTPRVLGSRCKTWKIS
jgi:cation-transporting ATPase I